MTTSIDQSRLSSLENSKQLTGLNLRVKWARGRLALLGLDAAVLEVLQTRRRDRWFEVYPGEVEVLAAVGVVGGRAGTG